MAALIFSYGIAECDIIISIFFLLLLFFVLISTTFARFIKVIEAANPGVLKRRYSIMEEAQRTSNQRTSTFLLASTNKNVEVRCACSMSIAIDVSIAATGTDTSVAVASFQTPDLDIPRL